MPKPPIDDELELGSPIPPKPKKLTMNQELRAIAAKCMADGKLASPATVWSPKGHPNPTWLKPHQFQTGKSGNPLGRPRRKLTEAYDEVLCQEVPDEMLKGRFEKLKGSGITFADLIAYNTALLAAFTGKRKGGVALAAAKEIADRTEGKVVQRLETNINVTHMDMTPEERRARLLELGRKSGDIIDAEWTDTPRLESGDAE